MGGQSFQSHVFRILVKHVVGARFRRAGNSVAKLRELDEFIVKKQRVPEGTEVQPVEVGGIRAEWVKAPGTRSDTAVLYLHGGALIMGSPATHRELAGWLSASTRAPFLVIDYRLAPEHPFPQAMLDALSAYHWLMTQGFTPDRIFLGGDSAGGGLALQTLLALRDEGKPLPAGAFLLSPQTDWVKFDGASYVTCARSDPMSNLEMCRFSASQYVGDNDRDTPLLSPVRMDLSGLPPLCIQAGDCDVLLSDAVRLAERAKTSGVTVEERVWPGMWHVFQASARFVPEARESIAEIGEFVNRRTNP